MKAGVEQDYAGFREKTSGKNAKAYAKLTKRTEDKACKTADSIACNKTMRKWIDFFHDHHLYMVHMMEVAEKMKALPPADPSFSKLSGKTVLLKVPSFDYSYKQAIDSLLKINHQLITSTPNLIIDLRGNGGGQDFSFNNIIPYLYSHPMIIYSVELWASPGNIASQEEALKSQEITEEVKQSGMARLERMKANPNTFVNLFDQDTFMLVEEQVYPMPQKVGIIIDEQCASSAEEFLLRAKQSKKVKLFGTRSMGCIDYSNIRPVWLPSGRRVYALPTSRSVRLPENPVDKTGIVADVQMKLTPDIMKRVQEHLEKQ